MAASKRNLAIRRLVAFAVDWLVIAAWAAMLFGVVMFGFSGHPPRPNGPWQMQVIGFAVMTLPVVLYFTLCESSVWQATLGKRALSLRVVYGRVGRTPFSHSLLRNIIKFLPWEMGHIVANQAFFSTSSGVPAWVYVPMLLAFGCPVWWVVSVFTFGYTPYDVIAHTRVVDGRNLPV